MTVKTLPALLALTALLFLAGCGGQPETPVSDNTPTATGDSRDLVPVDFAALNDRIQQTASTGKVTVVEVWATWCAPCVDLIPLMKQAAHERGDKMQLISVSVDGQEDAELAKTTLLQLEQDIQSEFGIDADLFSHALLLADPNDQQALLGDSIAPPTVFIYNADGSLHQRIDGSDANSLITEITTAIDAAIAAAG